MLSVVIADDEAPAREKLKSQLALLEGIEIVGIASNGKEAIELINNKKPALALLDIQMPEITGIELTSLLSHKPCIIYTTAFDNYAIQAFEVDSVDYLLKPYPLGRLKQAIDKVKARLAPAKAKTETYLSPAKRLVSKCGDRIHLMKIEDIAFFRADSGATRAYQFDRSYPVSDSLDQLEKDLDSNTFIRLHRSYLVNIDHIKEIQRWFNGKLMVLINDENTTELSTSRAGAEKLRNILKI